ncbi:hypothetical protein ACFLZW_07440, partial [Chloroflexota bacterium]
SQPIMVDIFDQESSLSMLDHSSGKPSQPMQCFHPGIKHILCPGNAAKHTLYVCVEQTLIAGFIYVNK